MEVNRFSGRQSIEQKEQTQSNVIVKCYKDFLVRFIQSTNNKILDPDRIAKCIPNFTPSIMGHLTVMTRSIGEWSNKTLKEKMFEEVDKLNLDVLDYQVWRQNNCSDLQLPYFDEQYQIQLQMLKKLEKIKEKLRKERQQQQRKE